MSYGHFYPWQLLTKNAGVFLMQRFEQTFDVARLQSELAEVLEHHEVIPHYRPYLATGWGAVTLVGPNGDPTDHRSIQVAKVGNTEYQKTPAMRYTPYIEEIVSQFPGGRCRVRLMQLQAGRRINWHHDGNLFGLDHQLARFHIPIVTNPDVHWQICHEDCHWEEGRLYFLDNSFPHRLTNGGREDRIHLVFDIEVSPELLQWFPQEMLDQAPQRRELRDKCARWVDQTLGHVYKFQKRLLMKRQKLSSCLAQRSLKPLRSNQV